MSSLLFFEVKFRVFGKTVFDSRKTAGYRFTAIRLLLAVTCGGSAMLLWFLDVLPSINGTAVMGVLSFLGFALLLAYDRKTSSRLEFAPERFHILINKINGVRYMGFSFCGWFMWLALLAGGYMELGGLLRVAYSVWPGVFALTCCLTLLAALNVYAACRFVCLRRGGSRLITKMLWVTPPAFFILYLLFEIIIFLSPNPAALREGLPRRPVCFAEETMFLHLAWSAGWLMYFSRSKNVKELNDWLEHPERLRKSDMPGLTTRADSVK